MGRIKGRCDRRFTPRPEAGPLTFGLGRSAAGGRRPRRALSACLFAAALVAASPAWAVPQDAVFAASRAIMEAYNSDDVERLRGILSGGAGSADSVEDVKRIVRACKASVGAHIQRLSLPVSGTNHYGFLEAYLDHDRADMLVEVDDGGKVVFWTLSRDILAGDLTCSMRSRGRPPRR